MLLAQPSPAIAAEPITDSTGPTATAGPDPVTNGSTPPQATAEPPSGDRAATGADPITNAGALSPATSEPAPDRAGSITNEGLALPPAAPSAASSPFHMDYTNRTAFITAAGGGLTTIRFTEIPDGSTLTTQYLAWKVHFTDGNDTTLKNVAFVTDNTGAAGNGRIHIRLTEPGIALGADFPGALTIELWDHEGGTLLYTSSNFAGSGTGFFGGIVAEAPFSFVVLRDWTDDTVYIDNLYIKDFPGYTDTTSLSAFNSATGGGLATIRFTEVPVGSTLTTQYLAWKVRFTDGNDVTLNHPNFVTDNTGATGNGRIHIQLTEPGIALGADFPGALTIELWDHEGGTLLYTSSNFAGSGTGFFGGVVAEAPFSFVVLRDWVDDTVYIDNLYIKDFPGYTDTTSFSAFNSAAGGGLATIRFTEVPVGSTLTTQFLVWKVRFTDGDDVTLNDPNFVTDNTGATGNGRIHIRLTTPGVAVGADFPGALTIELWDYEGGTRLYTSSDFAGSGTGFFGGVVAEAPFTFVVLRDWVDDTVYIDNLYLKLLDHQNFLPLILR
jgi:hypothetical protein